MEFIESFGLGEWLVSSLVTVIIFISGWLALRRSRLQIPPSTTPTAKDLGLQPPTTKDQPSPDAPAPTMEGALATTRRGLFDRLKNLFGTGKNLDADVKEELEEILYTSDLGPRTVEHLMATIEEKVTGPVNFENVRLALRNEITDILTPVQTLTDSKGLDSLDEKLLEGPKPRVWMIVGVNGVGKTTTIGKLSSLMAGRGLKVLVAAGDTFRAAASGQLKVWTERAQVEIFSPEGNAKPSGVAFDACQKAVNEKFDLVLLDTAGRLHTQLNLMEELKKIRRVLDKAAAGAPHQVLLVLDANSGQNALAQAREFHEALGVTGVILTKLDGTAKGGVAVGLAHELHLPIRAVGIGEKISDLRPFSTTEFVNSIL